MTLLSYYLPRSSAPHIITYKCELREVLLKALGQVSRLPIIGSFIGPGVARDEDFARDVGATCWYVQTKDGVSEYLNVFKSPAYCCTNYCSCVVDVDALTNTIGATGPASIDEIAAYIMLFDALA
jgi:hypothetical protein